MSELQVIPNGLAFASPIYFQAWVYWGGSDALILDHPPASCRATITSGVKPITMRKNWSTSLYTALVSPPKKVYIITIPAASQIDTSKSQCRITSSSFAKAYNEMPEENTVITAKVTALSPLVFSSKRMDRYSGTLL